MREPKVGQYYQSKNTKRIYRIKSIKENIRFSDDTEIKFVKGYSVAPIILKEEYTLLRAYNTPLWKILNGDNDD